MTSPLDLRLRKTGVIQPPPDPTLLNMESTPVVCQGKPLLVESIRPPLSDDPDRSFVHILDIETGQVRATGVARGHVLLSAFVHGEAMYLFGIPTATCVPDCRSWKEIVIFRSVDLRAWTRAVALEAGSNESLFNTSVCRADNRFIMAYETNDTAYVPFTIKFAESHDLTSWRKLPEALYGRDRYTACPTLRYVSGRFYMLYLEHTNRPGSHYETWLTRSHDLIHWQDSPRNPVIAPNPDGSENNNTSDADLFECGGKTHVYYYFCDQEAVGGPVGLTHARFDGTQAEFFESYYPSEQEMELE